MSIVCVMCVSRLRISFMFFFFFQAEDGIRDLTVTGVQTCALPILMFGNPCEEFKVNPVVERALDRIFILHADHEQNASTSTVRQIGRSEKHTSELQSQSNLVCRLLLEKKKKKKNRRRYMSKQ